MSQTPNPPTPPTPACSRCGAKWQEDPSCGKGEHLSLPPRPADVPTPADEAAEIARESARLANKRGTGESHEQAAQDAWAAVALLEEEGRTEAADLWCEAAEFAERMARLLR